MSRPPTALIADDEPLLRETMVRLLAVAWPELAVVAQARNGREAVEQFEATRPDVCFLDVQMPGLSGVDAARTIGRRAHVVFVTAFDEYAVEAFAQGALDYVVKPVQAARLADTVARLRARLREARPPSVEVERLLQELTVRLGGPARATSLRWVTAGSGATTRLIAVDEIDFLKSDEKYTLVAWRGPDGRPAEAVVRTPLKELVAQLDPQHFAQVHRSVVVNLRSVSHVTRAENETADIHLKGRPELLPVSRSYLHLFKQM
jgi:DNA-binding LytR/AlgR family response regulator